MGNLASQEARPDIAEAAVRSVQALKLRIASGSYRQIAKTLNVSVSVAHHYVVEALREHGKLRSNGPRNSKSSSLRESIPER